MTQWAEIRHLHLVDGVPKKEIARRLKLDVKTVRRAIGRSTPPVRVSPPRPQRPGPVAGADHTVAAGGAPSDREADSPAAAAVDPGRSPHARCGATSRSCGWPWRRRRPSCTAACGPETPWRSTSASRGSTSPACRARSSTWWRRCRSPTRTSPRRTRSSGSSRCSTASSAPSAGSAAWWIASSSITPPWRSRTCWRAGTGSRPKRSRRSGAGIRSGPSSARRRRAGRRVPWSAA